MPSKKDRVIDLVKEKSPIGDEDIYRATRPKGAVPNEVRRYIVDEGGMMKEDGDDVFFVIPASPEEREKYESQGYVPIRIRGR